MLRTYAKGVAAMAEEIKTTQEEPVESRNFIQAFIEEDIAAGGQ